MSTNGGDSHRQDGAAAAREIRELVADQLHDLVVEREGLGTLDEVVAAIRRLYASHERLVQARGRQRQARVHGTALAHHVAAEREARELLRQSVMSLGEACGSAVVGLDFDQRRSRIDSSIA